MFPKKLQIDLRFLLTFTLICKSFLFQNFLHKSVELFLTFSLNFYFQTIALSTFQVGDMLSCPHLGGYDSFIFFYSSVSPCKFFFIF